LVPVGGVYTVDAAGAKAVCDAIGAKCMVPMHYHHAPYGLPNVAGVEDFLALWPQDGAPGRVGAALVVGPETSGVRVPKCASHRRREGPPIRAALLRRVRHVLVDRCPAILYNSHLNTMKMRGIRP
ncbi:MAG: hypothetical protein Q4C45_01425, partial [Oscillospiraceae bacterium]|nr:hypothetical protein [Oscillospiraceae bacterium]